MQATLAVEADSAIGLAGVLLESQHLQTTETSFSGAASENGLYGIP